MYEKIKNYIIGVISKNIKYIRIGYPLIIIILWVYLLIINKLTIEYLVQALKVFTIVIIYWYIYNKFFYNEEIAKDFKIEKKILKSKNNWFKKYFNKLKYFHLKFYGKWKDKFQYFWITKLINNKKITIKTRINIATLIYYLRYCCVWIWHYLFFSLIYYEFFYIRIWFISRLDIIVKKYFKKQININNYYEYKIYKIFKWCVKDPIIRIFMYPLYLKQKLLQRSLYELIQLRLFLYCYISVLLYFGYNDVKEYIINNKIMLISIVWIYFAIIFPYIIKLLIQRYPKKNFEMYEKVSVDFFSQKKIELVITLKFFVLIFDYIKEIDRQVERYYYNKVKIWKHWNNEHIVYDIFSKYIIHIDNKIILPFLKYERSYFIPKYKIGILYFLQMESLFYKMDSLFDEGILRYGIVFMLKEYGHYYKQALDYNKCIVYFIFEMQRLTNQKLEIENWYEKFKFEVNYEEIPGKYEGMKLYKEIERYLNFFDGPYFFNGLKLIKFFFIPELYKSLFYHQCLYLIHNESILEIEKKIIDEWDKLRTKKNNGKFLLLQDRLCLDMYPKFAFEFNQSKKMDIVEFKNQLSNENDKKLILLEKTNDRLKDFYYLLWLEEYNEEVKRLKNVKSIEIVKKEINKYLKNYPGDKERGYEFIIPEMDETYIK